MHDSRDADLSKHFEEKFSNEANMVSRSGFARGFCLGRSTDSRIYRIGHWRKQYQHRSEHNSNESSDSRIANQHSDRRGYRLNRRNHIGQHSRTVNHHQSKHHDESKLQH
jgi:hypothetical protein